MNVLIFGATGMIGQGALLECLNDPSIGRIGLVLRGPPQTPDPRVEVILVSDLAAIAEADDRLVGYDACFFCAGISAVGLSEAEYTRITHDLTLAVARCLVGLNPAMTFLYVSGAGTDGTGGGRVMWARVKGRTENDLMALPFKAYMFRPGAIQPLRGIRSRTGWYNILYAATAPLMPMLLRRLPGLVTTTERLGKAMISVAASGYERQILETSDINSIG